MKMTDKPELCTHPEPFYLVGYPFETAAGKTLTERAAYWQGLKFPTFDAQEFEKLGSDGAEIGVWTHEDGRLIYVFGYVVPEIGYVPEGMRAVTIPGGEFAVFRAPAYKSAQELGDNLRETWRCACDEWLPGSAYEADPTRMAFEYYLGNSAEVYIPVKQK